MKHALSADANYTHWIRDLKQRVRTTQLKAAVRVNATLLEFYWERGRDIVAKQAQAEWDDGFLQLLSDDLSAEFPDMKGFSRRNMELVRRWYLFYAQEFIIAKQAVSQLKKSMKMQYFFER